MILLSQGAQGNEHGLKHDGADDDRLDCLFSITVRGVCFSSQDASRSASLA